MGLGWAAVAIGAASAGYGAYSASSSSQKAQDQNAENAKRYNNREERIFHQGRGAGGYAVLPEYGGGFEQQLWRDTAGAYNANMALQGPPEAQLSRYWDTLARFAPAFDQGSDVIDSIYSGAMQKQQLAEAQPVMAARTALASTQKQGILDDITARLGALDAANARRGFVGSGSAAQGAAIRQTAPLYQQAAGVGALANLQNAQQTQGINEANRQLQLNSLNLPGQRAQQSMALQQLPMNALNQATSSAQAPFGFFKIPIGQQSQIQMPTVQPVPNVGQIAGAGIGQLAGAYGNYAANQQLVNQLGQISQQPAYSPYQAGQYDYSLVPQYGGGYYPYDTGRM